ncbi:winged helix-turn-helix domain-containing protein [Candidatus Poribacteria bacterium]
MEEQLLDFIRSLKLDKSIESHDEAKTKQAIILRCLHILGWDTFNVDEVYPEYSVGKDRVDYSLRLDGADKVFLEAKKVSEDLEKHQKQLLNYSFQQGVKLAILSNGTTWWFYLPLHEGDWEQRKFYSIDIHQQEAEDVAAKFVDFLSKESIANGSALDNAEAVYKSQQRQKILQTTLPKAWNMIISEPDSLLVDLINETSESICGYRANDRTVKRFLSKYGDQLTISADTSEVAPFTLPKQIQTPKSVRQKAGSKESRKDSLLRLFSDIGGEGSRSQINERIPDYWELRPEELAIEEGTKKPLYWHHVASACQPLKDRYGYLENPKRGTWRLTDKGRAYLETIEPNTSRKSPASSESQDLPSEVKPITTDFKDMKLSSFYFKGSKYEVHSWRGLLLELSKLMYDIHRSDFDKVLGLRGTKRSYFARDENLLKLAKKIPDTGIFVEQNLSARNAVQVCRYLIDLFGYSDEDLEIAIEAT